MAEYSTISLSDAQALLDGLTLTVQEVSRLQGGAANSSFTVATRSGKFVLTLLDNHDAASAETMAMLTTFLISQGVRTPPIIEIDASKNRVGIHNGTPFIVRPFISGQQPSALSDQQLETVGSVLAQLHNVRSTVQTPLPRRQLAANWADAIGNSNAEVIEVTSWAKSEFEAVAQKADLENVLCHGDLFPDNMIWQGDDLVVLDWETASHDAAVLDVGITIVACCRDDRSIDWQRVQVLLDGYSKGRVIGDSELTALRPATRYAAAILMYQRFLRHNVRFPNPAKLNHFRELQELTECI